jgi:hypothetical protein
MNEITRRIDESDLPQDQRSPLVLLQAPSPQVINNDPPGSKAGMFTGFLGDVRVLLNTFVFLPIGFTLTHPEFAPDQKAPVFDHGQKLPRDAVFHYAHEGYPRSCHYLPNGNVVVPTVTLYMLVDHGGGQYPSAFRFAHSAYSIGRQFGSRAAALTAEVEGEKIRGCTVAKHKMTAVLETKNGKSYYVPKPVLFAKVGEAGYPLPQYDFAEKLRRAFKQGDDWASLEPPEPPPTLPPAPAKVVIEAEPPPADDNPAWCRSTTPTMTSPRKTSEVETRGPNPRRRVRRALMRPEDTSTHERQQPVPRVLRRSRGRARARRHGRSANHRQPACLWRMPVVRGRLARGHRGALRSLRQAYGWRDRRRDRGHAMRLRDVADQSRGCTRG